MTQEAPRAEDLPIHLIQKDKLPVVLQGTPQTDADDLILSVHAINEVNVTPGVGETSASDSIRAVRWGNDRTVDGVITAEAANGCTLGEVQPDAETQGYIDKTALILVENAEGEVVASAFEGQACPDCKLAKLCPNRKAYLTIVGANLLTQLELDYLANKTRIERTAGATDKATTQPTTATTTNNNEPGVYLGYKIRGQKEATLELTHDIDGNPLAKKTKVPVPNDCHVSGPAQPYEELLLLAAGDKTAVVAKPCFNGECPCPTDGTCPNFKGANQIGVPPLLKDEYIARTGVNAVFPTTIRGIHHEASLFDPNATQGSDGMAPRDLWEIGIDAILRDDTLVREREQELWEDMHLADLLTYRGDAPLQ